MGIVERVRRKFRRNVPVEEEVQEPVEPTVTEERLVRRGMSQKRGPKQRRERGVVSRRRARRKVVRASRRANRGTR